MAKVLGVGKQEVRRFTSESQNGALAPHFRSQVARRPDLPYQCGVISYDLAVIAIGGIVLIALWFIRSASYLPQAWLKERIHVAGTKGERDATFGKLKLGDEDLGLFKPA